MGKIISVCLQKGGTGKTTTATTVASILGNLGNKVLLIDMDSQSDISEILDLEAVHTVYDVFAGKVELKDTIEHEQYFDLVPGSEKMEIIENISSFDNSALSEILGGVKDEYDYILIDTPPALGRLLVTSLIASDYCIITVDTRPLAYKAMDSLYNTVRSVQKNSNQNLKILGVLIVMYEGRSTLNRQFKDAIIQKAECYGTKAFQTCIRRAVALAESQTVHKLLIDYAPRSNVAIDYSNVTKEIIKRIKGDNIQ